MADYLEKVKIYIPKNVYTTLRRDMELFEFTKTDGTFNQNAFINTLIANYFEEYRQSKQNNYQGIKEILSNTATLNDYQIDNLSSQIVRLIENQNAGIEKEKNSETISFRPTHISMHQYLLIQSLLGNESESNYFRQMFSSYAALPQNTRERIVFKPVVNSITEALKENKKLFLRFTNNLTQTVSPYALCPSKEELFNYLLCQDEHGGPATRRLTRIQQAVVIEEPAVFSKKTRETLKWSEENSPQYLSKPIIVKVKLTDEGKKSLKRVYIHRPKQIHNPTDDGLYYFETTKEQAMQYFFKFGKDAIVIKPNSLAIAIQKKHYLAQKVYYDHHKDNIDAHRKKMNQKRNKKNKTSHSQKSMNPSE